MSTPRVVPGLTPRSQPEPSLPDTAAFASLARLKKELSKLNGHLVKLIAQSQTPKLSKVQVDLVNSAFEDLQKLQKFSTELQPEMEELEEHKRAALAELYQAIGPLMIDSLLRYLAVEQHDAFLLNPTWRLPRAKQNDGPIFNHYASESFVKKMEAEKKLTPAVLDAYMPGWSTAYNNFVDTHKGRAATHLGNAHPFGSGGTHQNHEAEHWDPKLYDIVTGAPLAARIQQQRKIPEDNSNPVRIQDRDQHPPRNKQYPTGMPASPWFAKPTAPAVFQPGRR
ncbi:hypothetical protein JCM5296_005011 [Sporobolomyces johnsonii]